MLVERQKKDRDLVPVILKEKRKQERIIECESQIVNALEKGNPFSLLWSHPSGINPAVNRGCSVPLDLDLGKEKSRWEKRYNQLKKQREKKTMLSHVDADLMTKHSTNKETDARVYKDQLQRDHHNWKKQSGVIIELTQEEVIEEHEANMANCIEQINADRADLGLNPMRLVEEE